MKVDIPNPCRICGANLNSDKAQTCGEKCRKELRRWGKLLPVTQRDLLDAAMTYANFMIACDEAGGAPPPEIHLKAIKMMESAAVAYTMAAAKVGKLPKAEPREKHPARCDCRECRPELYV